MISFIQEGFFTGAPSIIKSHAKLALPMTALGIVPFMLYKPYNTYQRQQQELSSGLLDSSKYESSLVPTIEKHNQYISKFGNQISPEQRQQMVGRFHQIQKDFEDGKINHQSYAQLNQQLNSLNKNYDHYLNNTDSGMIDNAMNFMGDHHIGTAIGAGAIGLGGLAAGLSWWKNRQQLKKNNNIL